MTGRRFAVIQGLIGASMGCLVAAVWIGDRGDPLVVPGMLTLGLAIALIWRWGRQR